MRRRLTAACAAWLCWAILATPVHAQDTTRASAGAERTAAVYLDCTYLCDSDYIRTEIAYVNWVRDRTASDVDVLTSTQSTGAGGTQYTFTFLGQGHFAHMADTLSFSMEPGATSDAVRKTMVRVLKSGLVRYLAHTAMADQLRIDVAKAKNAADQTTPKRDPWHAWVFSTSMNGDAYAEQSTRYRYLSGTLSASRTTAAWKLRVSANENYNENQYDLTDPDTTIVSIQRGFGLSALAVKSLSDRWSAGLTGSLTSSTFLNEKRNLNVEPAIEFDVWPYAESTRRQLRLQYGIGVSAFAYNDTTIFLKTSETLPVHSLTVAYAQQEAWGTLNLGVTGRSFLNDGSKHSANLSSGVSLHLIRGLSLNLSAFYSLIHDQLYLPKGTATRDEVLLQQRQLLTSYEWSGFVGLSYTFGSLLNNVVNPRFGNDNGGTTMIMF
ncbi:MAG: hypothetical protein KGL38_00015 [Gemmatimonadota bacterium]|nr:hypothetical protein [Gemmatimonadota bacterium]MDE3126353.1 hypothetical protein [Gemmatimonadota bacterium]MDE3173913.1 hypothetical protein [Gemmatimonadota bacterium]MDE3214748.1 hypothetical protein [Gemmatimonadota bacterium]